MKILLAITLLGGLLTSPAWATEAAAPPAPTGVRIEWADATREMIRVSWSDSGSANRVRLVPTGSAVGPDRDVPSTTTGNSTAFWRSEVPLDVASLEVQVTSYDGSAESVPARSVRFDSLRPPVSRIVWAVPRTDGQVPMSWVQDEQTDLNPGDPLDLPTDLGPARPTVHPLSPSQKVYPVPAGARSFVLPRQSSTTYGLGVVATNVWGTRYKAWDHQVTVKSLRTRLESAPKSQGFGTRAQINFALLSGPPMWGHRSANLGVTLEARDNATKPWQRIETSYQGQFFPMLYGMRQYRIVVPTFAPKYPEDVAPWSAGAPFTIATTYVGWPRAFNNGQPISLGQKVSSRLEVKPAVNVNGALQRYDGTKWIHVQTVPVRGGVGVGTATAIKRGTTNYRIVLPSTTWANRTISPRTWGLPLTAR
ncbi:hypothetical protein [Kribbella deserti]|uniref:Uncharacterized protein n=1 Tax=Kribbella deserti TaxID=1926257 RepID=A0ABV6QPD8_9ACTN